MINFFYKLFKRIKVSYGITVCNEAEELERLLDFILKVKDQVDEVIILQDVTNKNEEVTKVIDSYRDQVLVKESKLNGDFSAFKNTLIEQATGDYLFQIDADEMPQESLIKKLKVILRKKNKYDCFLVPRINIVNGISESNISEWNWKMDDSNRINFPDYQTRIFKLNHRINWKNKVHEELTGWTRQYHLSTKTDDFCLWHIKNIEKQIIQNQFYKKLS